MIEAAVMFNAATFSGAPAVSRPSVVGDECPSPATETPITSTSGKYHVYSVAFENGVRVNGVREQSVQLFRAAHSCLQDMMSSSSLPVPSYGTVVSSVP